MKLRTFSCALLLIAGTAQADLVIVGNPKSSVASIPLSQLSRLFLGQAKTYSNGTAAMPMDVSGGSREQFYRDVLKRQPAQVEKYWARMIFTGKAQPPREVRAADVKMLVAETPGAISYLDSSKVDGSVKIIAIDSAN